MCIRDSDITLAGAELILVGEVEDSVDIGTLVLYLVHDTAFWLYAVHPFRKGVDGVLCCLTRGGVHGQHAGCFRQVKEPPVLIGSDDPVGHPVIIQLKGIVCKALEQAASKQTDMAVQVVQYIRIGLVFNLVVRHKGNIADIAGRHHDIARGAVHVLKPFEEAGVFQGNHPDPVSYTHLDVYKRQPSCHAGIL